MSIATSISLPSPFSSSSLFQMLLLQLRLQLLLLLLTSKCSPSDRFLPFCLLFVSLFCSLSLVSILSCCRYPLVVLSRFLSLSLSLSRRLLSLVLTLLSSSSHVLSLSRRPLSLALTLLSSSSHALSLSLSLSCPPLSLSLFLSLIADSRIYLCRTTPQTQCPIGGLCN